MGDWWLDKITPASIPYYALLVARGEAKEPSERKRSQTITPFSFPAHLYQNLHKGLMLSQLWSLGRKNSREPEGKITMEEGGSWIGDPSLTLGPLEADGEGSAD